MSNESHNPATEYMNFVVKDMQKKTKKTNNTFWSLTLGEEHRLRVLGNRVLRIFGPRGEEVTGGWNKLHNEELHNLYYICRV
jgi:hypothetical protein